jgi:LacI family transcriptional regulator
MACLLADTDNDVGREASVLDELVARRCEGLIVATATRSSRPARGDVPVVLVTRDTEDADLPLVAADDAAGVRAVVAHLRGLGHARIGCVTGPPELSTTARRLAALRERLPDAPVVHGDAFTVPAGERAAAELLRGHPEVTAIVAGNDMIALGCYAALEAAGLRCPQDVSVTGHNDMPLVGRVRPALTTVAIPQREIGRAAARVLLERLKGEGGARRILLPTSLAVRESTAPPRS